MKMDNFRQCYVFGLEKLGLMTENNCFKGDCDMGKNMLMKRLDMFYLLTCLVHVDLFCTGMD